MIVGVFGSSGGLGSVVAEELERHGVKVIHFTRSEPREAKQWRRYDMTMTASEIDLDGLDAVVNCAYSMSLAKAEHLAFNSFAVSQLAYECGRCSVPLFNLSSVVACQPNLSWYAATKASCERSVLLAGGVNLRIGVILDMNSDPARRAIHKIAHRLRFLFVGVPRGLVWRSRLRDLVDFLLAAISNVPESGNYWLADSKPITFVEFVRDDLRRVGLGTRVIQLPYGLFALPLAVLDRGSSRRSPLSMDSIRGLRLRVPDSQLG